MRYGVVLHSSSHVVDRCSVIQSLSVSVTACAGYTPVQAVTGCVPVSVLVAVFLFLWELTPGRHTFGLVGLSLCLDREVEGSIPTSGDVSSLQWFRLPGPAGVRFAREQARGEFDSGRDEKTNGENSLREQSNLDALIRDLCRMFQTRISVR